MSKIKEEKIRLIQALYAKGLSRYEICKKTQISRSLVYFYTNIDLMERFGSFTKYKEHLAERKGFMTYHKYRESLIKKRGFISYKEYEAYMAKKKGFNSLYECQKYRVEKRQYNALNKKFSKLLLEQLIKLNKTQRGLATELGINESAVSRYMHGKTLPKKSLQERLFNIIELPYKTIEDILNS